MAKFKFTLIQKIFSTNQEFIIGSKVIEAPNYDKALKIFNSLDVPMHTVTTVQKIR